MAKIDQQIDREFARAGVPAPAPAPAPAPVTRAAPPPPPVTEPKVDELHEPDGWLVRHNLTPYAGFDPKQVDVTAFIAWATVEAKKSMPDAKLIRVDVDNVDRSGHADLTLASFAAGTGNVDVRFVSASRVPPDPNGHKPFGFAWKCEFRVIAGPDNIELRGLEGFPCGEAPVRAPRCGPAVLWKRVRQAVPDDKRVDLIYRVLPTGAPGWDFNVKGLVEERYADDC